MGVLFSNHLLLMPKGAVFPGTPGGSPGVHSGTGLQSRVQLTHEIRMGSLVRPTSGDSGPVDLAWDMRTCVFFSKGCLR